MSILSYMSITRLHLMTETDRHDRKKPRFVLSVHDSTISNMHLWVRSQSPINAYTPLLVIAG